MSFTRANVLDNQMARPARIGDGWLAYLAENIQALDSNQTLGASSMVGGLYTRAGMTAARSDTVDTAVNILAAMPQLDIGESFLFAISVQTAFVLTLLTAAGVTLAGKVTVPASGYGNFLVTKTSATTVTIKGL